MKSACEQESREKECVRLGDCFATSLSGSQISSRSVKVHGPKRGAEGNGALGKMFIRKRGVEEQTPSFGNIDLEFH